MEQMQLETTLRRLDEGVWAIDQGMVRSFLVVGTERALLLDTGAAPCDLWKLIREATDKPVTLAQTHADGDHTANSALFPEVWAHPAEFPQLLRDRPELEGRLRPLADGQVFELGGRTLEVLVTPGHTPGSVCLLDRADRALYAGDTVSLGPVFLFGPGRDIRTYRETLGRLWALDAYDRVYPCHNRCPLPKEALAELTALTDGILDGSIPGTEPEDFFLPVDPKPRLYPLGDCGIFYLP